MIPMTHYKQWIIWDLWFDPDENKYKKMPVDARTGNFCNAHNPDVWLTYEQAVASCKENRIGFVFTKDDPFFFVDVDHCLINGQWSQQALFAASLFPGAAMEISQSGTGLHIFGMGACPPHSCKNESLGIEFYTEGRFAAITGYNATGYAGTDFTHALPAIVDAYFPPKVKEFSEWTTTGTGIQDDEELIKKALKSKSVSSIFGGRASFEDLWTANTSVLSQCYPSDHRDKPYNASIVDMALAQHLAFWSGCNCEQIMRIMLKSALVREKWFIRDRYLQDTIIKAVSMQESKYENPNAIRERLLATCPLEDVELIVNADDKFIQKNRDKSVDDILKMLKPITTVACASSTQEAVATDVSGFQFLGRDLMRSYFSGCVYIMNMHRIFSIGLNELLKPEQFNAAFGGYIFQLDDNGKTTRKAWEAFTESQVMRFPKVNSMCFKPGVPAGKIIIEEGRLTVNTYVETKIDMKPGDISPFTDHLKKVLPNATDREILLSYMAACIQHKGTKFQWAPLLQGTEGNGKTLFTRCVAYAIGKKYTHYPKAADIDNKFNGWLLNKLFIGVEDIFVPEHKREVIEALKPMITGDGLEIQFKGVDQITADICCNFILNSNHRDAIMKTKNDRRFAVFYTAQQSADDLVCDGMTGDYFPQLYEWLRNGGYSYVAHFLAHYNIPEILNPAKLCHRAPHTSSEDEVFRLSATKIEQEIVEAIEEGRQGFAGGWISSVALDNFLKGIRASIPQNKRKELLNNLGYVWHPVLTNGRANAPVLIDGGKKPVLFVKKDSPAMNIQNGAEVIAAYSLAQGHPG